MKKFLIPLMGASLMTITSCSTTTGVNAGAETHLDLVGSKWQLADKTNGKIPTLVVEAARASGNAACNNYMGQLQLDKATRTFKVQNISSTRMACDEMTTETNYLRMLNRITQYRQTKNTLELYEGNMLLLKFNRIP